MFEQFWRVSDSDIARVRDPLGDGMSVPTVLPVVDAGLGNSAYLVDLGDGRALAVDPSRDLRALQATADKAGLRVAFAADTHLHADFLSGARQLAVTDGAALLASGAGGREYDHVGLGDDDEVDLGGLRMRALATPGHTDDHLSFLLLDGQRPVGVFSGGSLIVGAAARTDLVDLSRTEELARAQYASLRRLAALPDDVALWPTHGAGSFCSAPPGAQRTSTIGAEKATNPLLDASDEDSFVEALLGSLGSYPSYFTRLPELNRRGPALLEADLALPGVPAVRAWQLIRDGAVLVDSRSIEEFAAGHVTGSLSVQLRDAFATWLGWLVPADRPLLVLRGEDQDPAEIAWQAAKVGYDTIAGPLVGELAGGWPAAVAAGLPTSTTRLVTPAEVIREQPVVDVRQAGEFAAGHVPGARHVELGSLMLEDVDTAEAESDEQVVVMCGHGERAMSAASVLERTGRGGAAVLLGGPDEWAAAHHGDVETSS
jgi:glyoxylase-like metal-dependent hydrolase (beta-lactamase superfamily II)/rhodanese-related sulfurtransferase